MMTINMEMLHEEWCQSRELLQTTVLLADWAVGHRLAFSGDTGHGQIHAAYLHLMNPTIHAVSLGRAQSQQIKSEMLWAGSITKLNWWIILMGNTKEILLLSQRQHKFGKWQHAWYVFIQSYFKTQILQSIITHLPFNNPVILFCPA